MKGNKATAGCIFFLTTVCLIITSLMTRQSGVSQGSTAEGQQYLGFASIAIHLGLPVFGIAAGAFFRSHLKILGVGMFVLVLLCAMFSIRNIMNFVAAERISIAKKNDADAKGKAAREASLLKAAEERQKTINKMAQDQLAWTRSTVKEADGRRERKDSMDAGTKFITDFAKTEIAVAPTTTDPNAATVVQSEAGAELLAEMTGWKVSAIQLGDVVQIAVMLIIFESFGWTIASYLWGLNPPPAAARVGTLEAPEPPKPLGGPPRGGQKLLPSPSSPKNGTGGKEKALTIRTEPSPEWRALLDEIDYPPPGARYNGPLRPKDKREHAALRLLCWMGAYKESGDYTGDQLKALYEEFAQADHRVGWADRIVKPELEVTGRKIASKRQQNGATLWTIHPPNLDKLRAMLEKARVITVQEAPADPLAHEPEVEEVEDSTRNVIMANFWPRRTSTLPN